MRILQRRLAAVALLSAAISITPAAGSGLKWLRGGSETVETDKNVQHQRRGQVVFQFPTPNPTPLPSSRPSAAPSESPTNGPTTSPSVFPTSTPTASPSFSPTSIPSDTPSLVPSKKPTGGPSTAPSDLPSDIPSLLPTSLPSDIPSELPSLVPSDIPSTFPTASSTPTAGPSSSSSPTISNPPSVEASQAPSPTLTRPPTAAASQAPSPTLTRPPTATPPTAYTPDVAYDQAPEGPEETDEMEEAEDADVVAVVTRPPVPLPTTSPTSTAPTAVTPAPTPEVVQSLATESSETEWRKTFYEGDSWDSLPMNAKAAALTLGYDLLSWDFGKSVFSDSLTWDQLTQEQAMAATILGYDSQSWMAKHIPEPTEVVPGVHTSGGGFSSAWTASEGSITQDVINADYQGSIVINTFDNSPAQEEGDTTEVEQLTQPQAQVTPDYLTYQWADLPDLQKEAAKQLGHDQISWDSDQDVITSFLTWNQMTFDLRQAAKALGLHQQSWNTAVQKRPPTVDGSVSSHASFYSHQEAAAAEAEAEAAEVPVVFDEPTNPSVTKVTPYRGANGANNREKDGEEDEDPEIASLEREMGDLRKQLTDAREQISTHQKILEVLQNVDPDATIGSIADIIQLSGRKKERGNGRKKRNQEDRVQPVALEKRAAKGENAVKTEKRNGKNLRKKNNLKPEPAIEATSRTFFFEEGSSGEEGPEASTRTFGGGKSPVSASAARAGGGGGGKTRTAWAHRTQRGTPFGVGVP